MARSSGPVLLSRIRSARAAAWVPVVQVKNRSHATGTPVNLPAVQKADLQREPVAVPSASSAPTKTASLCPAVHTDT